MDPTQSNNDFVATMSIPEIPDVQNMLATLVQSQESMVSLINNLKEDVDRMKVSSSPKYKRTNHSKQNPLPRSSGSQNDCDCSKSEHPRSTSHKS
ncbi:hypothetical protein O181_005267 [Austropuccinia psidii MF-1]|uniref:Uncharacterized protein n=1 Tax=Austropuccinia psidii MF-1 TaxID=1389203 RepID=A0A9Q3GGI7_9BASI|nr:hypothetical protein [Austropuccinia psidii MF-1]